MMEYCGKCVYCGGDVYAVGEDQWWVCTGCGCVWRLDGVLVSQGQECSALSQPVYEQGRPALGQPIYEQ